MILRRVVLAAMVMGLGFGFIGCNPLKPSGGGTSTGTATSTDSGTPPPAGTAPAPTAADTSHTTPLPTGPTLPTVSLNNDRVTKENFDKIKVGMTEAEVSAILGEPATTTPVEIPGQPTLVTKSWLKGTGGIVVSFQEGKVTSMVSNGL